MTDNLVGYGIPFIFNPKTREEKIEEARQSGLIGKKNNYDFAGAKYGQEIICKRCGSRNILVGAPIGEDTEKGLEIPYFCKECGYKGKRVAKVKKITDDGTLVVDLIPDGLVGLEGYGSFANSNKN